MNIEQLRQYCLSKKEVTEGFPFDADTLVFKVMDKVFALISLDKWDADNKGINLKCDPSYAEDLRAEYSAITPGYHMNKKHWNTLDLSTDEVSPELLFELIDHSYDMVVKGMTKKCGSSCKIYKTEFLNLQGFRKLPIGKM